VSQWMLWMLLSWITGSPIGSLAVLALLWFLSDRFTFRVLPDPLRLLGRWRRMRRLRITLSVNPHDRRARFELAERLLETGHPGEAAQVLRPNVEAGDEDAHTAYVMGAALGRTGAYEQAERALELVRLEDPRFRSGEVDLELGRQRLARRDFAGARDALGRLLAERPGSVEGRYHLARALSGLGDEAAARKVRDEAWSEYRLLPRFHRRHERPFAWRIKPWRPVAIAAVLAAIALLAATAVARAPAQHPPPGQAVPGDVQD
jgi:tetratricopeptide (TPR) repeat protein